MHRGGMIALEGECVVLTPKVIARIFVNQPLSKGKRENNEQHLPSLFICCLNNHRAIF